MASQLQKLMFSIDLLDRVTGPAGRIKKTLGGVATSASSAFSTIAGGAAGVAAAGATLTMLVAPAHSMAQSMGEVASLGVGQSTLQGLADDAIDFSVKYGGSAAEVVRSSYDIQSAIAGLKGNDLARFTVSSAVLAKATKSDASTITDYMGTMYGIFGKTADAMGKGEWVTQLTGQTATAVQMFKTTGSDMASAFSNLGAAATSKGIAQANQMAILGTLQATMSGARAGTAYTAFLAGVGGAQEKLGLSFVDSQGQMLGMVEILEKLKGKFGDTIDVAEGDAIKKAFGSKEALKLIDQLLPKADSLAASIDAVGKVTGMEKSEQMAATIADPFEQFSAGISAVSVGLGSALLPVLYPALSAMASAAGALYKWTQAHPTLTKNIGYAVLSVTALVAGTAAFAAASGLASLAIGYFSKQTALSTLVSRLFSGTLHIARFAMSGLGLAMRGGALLTGLLSGALGVARTSMLWLNAAMLANPIGAIVGLAALLIGGIGALVYYWDDLKASFADFAWVQGLMGWIEDLLSRFEFIGAAADWLGDKLGFLGFGDAESIPSTSPSLSAPRQRDRLKGGVSSHVANAISSTNSSRQVTNYTTVNTNRQVGLNETNGQLMLAGA